MGTANSIQWRCPMGGANRQQHFARMLVATLIAGALALMSWAPLGSAQSAYAPMADLGPVFIDFGTVNVGVRKTVPVTVKNLTTTMMTFAGGGFNTPSAEAGFSSNGGTCGGGLAAGASCAFNYSFRPPNNQGTDQIGSTSLSVISGGRSQSFPLSFIGRGTGNLVVMRPRSIDFGDWLIGETAVVPVEVTNTQDVAVSFSGGGFNTGNGFSANGGTCGGGLAAGASCQFNYSFTPGQLGPVQNATTLGATRTAPTIHQNFPIQVSGNGVGSVGIVAIAPIGIGFGPVKLGSRVTVPLRFTNLDAVTINYSGGGVSAPSMFSGAIGGGAGCTSSTATAGATCAINYHFRPLTLGDHSASTSMSFSRPGANQNQPYQLSGSAVGELAQVSPQEFDLGEVAIGTSISVPVTILNDGDLDLSGFVGGGVASPFSQTNNCSGTLAPGASCTFTYTFNAHSGSIGLREALTLVSFTNTTGIQPTYEIRMRATGVDRLFRDGFE
jgi:hypothetical protein